MTDNISMRSSGEPTICQQGTFLRGKRKYIQGQTKEIKHSKEKILTKQKHSNRVDQLKFRTQSDQYYMMNFRLQIIKGSSV